ncbi:MAG: rhodanese-like domain-containing protein [Anaerolineaceae bacterium]|jgi:rhodanese-related sulfurtransferase|nr:rhodanese-like domain-containing protein [Anaerolineaceae bacterium]
MSRKLYLPIMLVVMFSMLLGACAPAATPEVEQPVVVDPTAVVVAEPTAIPTEAPVVEAPDFQAIFAEIIANNGKDKGYGTVAPDTINTELIENPDLFVIDVREPSELEANGHIPGAVNIPVKTLADNPALLPADLDEPIVVYCKSGTRSTWAWTILSTLGYTDVRNLAAGFDGWLAAQLPAEEGLAPAEEISTAIIENEALYMAVKDFANNAPEGWAAIKPVDVNEKFINGEEFVLIDNRRVDEYEAGYIDGAINIPLEEMMSRLDEIDSDAKIVIYCRSGIRGMIGTLALRMLGYDALNMSGGYLGWQAEELPVVGSAPDFTSLFASIIANNGKDKAYGTMSADALNTELIENPDLFVIDVREPSELEENGHIPGAVNIPVKTIVDNPALLPADLDAPIVVYCKSGTRSTFAWTMLNLLGYTNVRNMSAGMDGWLGAQFGAEEGLAPAEEISTAIIADEKLYMAVKEIANNPPESWASVKNVDVNEMLINAEDFVLVDNRRADEYAEGYIDPAINIPLEEMMSRLGELDKTSKIIIYCRSGVRGLVGTLALRLSGFDNAYNMSGGILGWQAAELPVVTP